MDEAKLGPDSQIFAEEGSSSGIGDSECERKPITSHLPRKEKSSESKFLDEGLEEVHAKPWFVGPILVLAVLAVSSAGAVTKSMVGAAPITNAGWRLQVTSIILLPGFIWQWLHLPQSMRERAQQSTNLTILGFSGVALALHFGLWVQHFVWALCIVEPQSWRGFQAGIALTGPRASAQLLVQFLFGNPFGLGVQLSKARGLYAGYSGKQRIHSYTHTWVWSLDHTSLAHSLLFVSTPPIVLAVLACLQGQPLSRGELTGVVLGMGGVLVIAAGSQAENDNDVTLLGDLGAFAAAIAFVVYISAGRHLRGWMPLYVYAFPVTLIGALLLALGGIGLEGLTISSSGEICGPFSWVRQEYWLPTLYLALGPGFVGHTGLNAVLRYSSSLVIAMAVTLEPPLGTALGWILHVASAPGIWTCVGGLVLLLGTLWVNYASEQRKVKLSSKDSTLSVDNIRGDHDNTNLLLDP